MRRAPLSLTLLLTCVLLAACDSGHAPTAGTPPPAAPNATDAAFYADSFERRPTAAELTQLGRALFSDVSLSASGRMSCASCHDPARAFGPPNDLPAQLGGADLTLQGIRAVPSLRYVQNVPPFTEHRFDESVDESEDQGPAGGHTWDGRADSVHDQARLPLLSRFEMANGDEADVARKLAAGAQARQMRAVFGAHVLDDPARTFRAATLALEVFQQSPAEFYPFDSKYDAWLRGKIKLDPRELRGLALFNEPKKGNCASCHTSQIQQGSFPVFSDFGLVAVGVPRNAALTANHDAAYHDLGLCGPERTDLAGHPEYCGLFRTPTLRNVALRQVFFHNGVFRDLRQAVAFYATRDLQPQKWYPRGADGKVQRYDDLPPQYWKNLNVDPPFDRKPGEKPALSATDIDDIVAFLGTLTDGFTAP